MSMRVLKAIELSLIAITIFLGVLLIAVSLNAGMSTVEALKGVLWVHIGTFGFPIIVFLSCMNLFFKRKCF